MRKNNRTFVKSMIITSVIGFSVLMITMFVGIKYYVDKSAAGSQLQVNSTIDTPPKPTVEYSSTMFALVKQIDKENLIAFDIEKNREITRSITLTTKVSDISGSVIPLSSIKAGDLVEVVFQPDEQKILTIKKTSRSWIKPDISGVVINPSNFKVVIGKKTYSFSKDTMIFRENGRSINPSLIGEYDVLELQGVEDTVWSIKVLQTAASIDIIDLPSTEGMLEINRTRMIPLKDITEPVSLTPGNYKLLISIKGYEPVVKEISVIAGEHLEISLKDAKEAFTELDINVVNKGIDYTIKVGDQTFKKGQKIAVKYGKYPITIIAEGHITWEREIELDTPTYDINVTLQKEPEKMEQGGIDGNNPIIEGGTSNNSNGSSNSNNMYTINISSNPSGAYVYIGGLYKGQTPYRATLSIGDYTVSLEKPGYQNYYTTIIIDGSDTQNNFLYELIPQ